MSRGTTRAHGVLVYRSDTLEGGRGIEKNLADLVFAGSGNTPKASVEHTPNRQGMRCGVFLSVMKGGSGAEKLRRVGSQQATALVTLGEVSSLSKTRSFWPTAAVDGSSLPRPLGRDGRCIIGRRNHGLSGDPGHFFNKKILLTE